MSLGVANLTQKFCTEIFLSFENWLYQNWNE